MKLTVARLAGLRDVTVRRWNLVWQRHGQFYDKPVRVPPALIQKGVEIVDMKEYMQPKFEQWYPPVPDDPRWAEPVPLEDLPDWKPESAFTFDSSKQIYEGVTQACLIAKAQHLEGLPPGVEKLVGTVNVPNKDVLLQRAIMLAQAWHTDNDKLPRRKPHPEKPWWIYKRERGVLPEKAALILLKSMFRMCQSQRAHFPSIGNRKQITEPLLDSHILYKGKPIVQREELPLLMTSDTYLPPFGDADLVAASVAHKLPDMWPVFPTVDFDESNNYELNIYPGFKKPHRLWCPHTIVQVPQQAGWSDSQYQASQILTSLFLTAALAKQRFGADVGELPEPISVQHVMLQESKLFLTFFQLNTLDLDSTTGVKNLVWTSQPSEFFKRIISKPWLRDEPQYNKLVDFDGSGFEPFLAAYLYGLPELGNR